MNKNLLDKIREEVEAGRVFEQTHPEFPYLSIFKYSDSCHYDNQWNEINRICRGLIINTNTGEVLARSFPKFFNLGEMPESSLCNLPDEPFEVWEKMDGCFAYETPVLLSDGTYKNIGEIVSKKLNVEVLSYDIKNNRFVNSKIKNYFKRKNDKNWLRVYFHNYRFSLKTTPNHHFYTHNGYRKIETLRAGDEIYIVENEPSQIQKEMIIGSLLGDSSICVGNQKSGVFQGGNKIKEYVEYKLNILGDLKTKLGSQISGFGTLMYRYNSRRLQYFNRLRNEWYPKEKKIIPKNLNTLSDISVAFWYMDDGSLAHNKLQYQKDRAIFSTNAFSKLDCTRLANILSNKYGIIANVFYSKGWNIRINAGKHNEINCFWSAITPYIHPNLRYKVPIEYRNLPFYDISTNQKSIKINIKYKIKKIKSIKHWSQMAYDIETEQNNYYANGVLVHNSMVSLYRLNNEWHTATPGSMASPQAIEAAEILKQYNTAPIPFNVTPVFEVIYPANRIVCDYGSRRELVLLAVFETASGQEWHRSTVDNLAAECGFPRPRRFDFKQLSNLPFAEGDEGYVIRFRSGLRIKAKSPIYVMAHRFLSNISISRVIEGIRDGTITKVTVQCPETWKNKLDDLIGMVNTRFAIIKQDVEYWCRRALEQNLPSADRKTLAIWIQAHVPKERQAGVFMLLSNKDITDLCWKLTEEQLKNENMQSSV